MGSHSSSPPVGWDAGSPASPPLFSMPLTRSLRSPPRAPASLVISRLGLATVTVCVRQPTQAEGRQMRQRVLQRQTGGRQCSEYSCLECTCTPFLPLSSSTLAACLSRCCCEGDAGVLPAKPAEAKEEKGSEGRETQSRREMDSETCICLSLPLHAICAPAPALVTPVVVVVVAVVGSRRRSVFSFGESTFRCLPLDCPEGAHDREHERQRALCCLITEQREKRAKGGQ